MLEKTVRLNRLFDFYGTLLTEQQAKILKLYYHQDLSLSEIATSENCSRQAVHDTLNRAASNLEKYERKLEFLSKREQQKKKLIKLKNQLKANETENAKKTLAEVLQLF